MDTIRPALENLELFYLVSGIANALALVIGLFWVLVAGLTTFGCGCILIVLPMINAVVMVFDFMAYSRLDLPPSPDTFSFLRLVAVLDILACFAIVPLVMGVLSLVTLGKPEIYAYFMGESVE